MSGPIYFAEQAATIERHGGIFIIGIAGHRFAMRPHDLEATGERVKREVIDFHATISPPTPIVAPAPAKKRRARGAGS